MQHREVSTPIIHFAKINIKQITNNLAASHELYTARPVEVSEKIRGVTPDEENPRISLGRSLGPTDGNRYLVSLGQ